MRGRRFMLATAALVGALGCGGKLEVLDSGAGSGHGGAGPSMHSSSSAWSDSFATQTGEIGSIAANAAGAVAISGTFCDTLHLGGVTLSATSPDPTDPYCVPSPFLATFDPDGGVRWAKALPYQVDGALLAVAIDSAGYVVVANTFQDAADFGGCSLVGTGGWDVGVARFDPSGALLWCERFGDADNRAVDDVAVTPAGDIVLTGTLGVGPGAMLGTVGLDFYLAKFDAEGHGIWARQFAASAGDAQLSRISINENAEIALAVNAHGLALGAPWNTPADDGVGTHVAKFDASGEPLWSTSITGPNAHVWVDGVALGSGGDIALLAETTGQVAMGQYTLSGLSLAVFDASGATRWARSFPAQADLLDYGVGMDPQGEVLVVSSLAGGSIDFGNGPLPMNGGATPYCDATAIARFSASGTPIDAAWVGGVNASIWPVSFAPVPGGSAFVIGGNYVGPADLGQGPLPPATGDPYRQVPDGYVFVAEERF